MLTDKAKEDFKKYLFTLSAEVDNDEYGRDNFVLDLSNNSYFEQLPLSMQYGVYVDWFDSVGMCIEISMTPTIKDYYFMIDDDADEPIFYKTRHEARTKAIEKANEIYNDKTKTT